MAHMMATPGALVGLREPVTDWAGWSMMRFDRNILML